MECGIQTAEDGNAPQKRLRVSWPAQIRRGFSPEDFLLKTECTDAEASAITGHSRQMVDHYARQVNQRKLAAAAVLKWETADTARTEPEQNL